MSGTTGATVRDIAHRLATPPTGAPWWRDQSLADGAAGVALLHIERAHAGLGRWETAHAWLTAATKAGIDATIQAGLYRGAPAVAFALHAANANANVGAGDAVNHGWAGQSGRYARATAALDDAVTALTHRRIDNALARIDRAELPAMAEYDVINGLAGIGAHLLRHQPGGDALARVLSYLVRLTEPLRTGGDLLPGSWTGHSPDLTGSPGYPGGHGNFGLAHGITGPLALLALAMRRAAIVDGQTEAIERICAWLDAWRQDHHAGSWWPQWITGEERHTGRPVQTRPGRPSWCYGTPGIARAQQLAGIATGDTARQRMAERALADCLTDASQLDKLTDHSLCHGWAGLSQTAWRAARDATTPTLAARLPDIAARLLRQTPHLVNTEAGFLEGEAGTALALHTAAHGTPPASGWDACLLID